MTDPRDRYRLVRETGRRGVGIVRATYSLALVTSPFALGGCPLTDDYYLKSERPQSGSGGTTAGANAVIGGGNEATARGGAESLSEAGASNQAGTPDGGATTSGCTGFAVTPGTTHGYMLCIAVPETWTEANRICQGAQMRLAWLESAEENAAVSAAIGTLADATDVLIGATDQAKEGAWFWDGNGGFQFWHGAGDGVPVVGVFNAWLAGEPNNANNAEDCAALNPATATWVDRSCEASYPFLCEDLD